MKYLALIIFILQGVCVLQAQRNGLYFDSLEYKQFADISMKRQLRGGLGSLPNQVTLRNYCPSIADQGDDATCVGFAVSTAVTIAHAQRLKIQDPFLLNLLRFSPNYLYNQLTKSNSEGTSLPQAFKLMVEKGICKYLTFKGMSPRLPNPMHHSEAQFFRLSSPESVFHPDSSDSVKLQKLKVCLSERKPIILCIQVDSPFLKGQLKIPMRKILPNYHAICLIGYDDRSIPKTFELLNSWGTTWGDKGFLQVSQQDLMKIIKSAYWLKLNATSTPPNEVVLQRYNLTTALNVVDEVKMDYDSTQLFLKYRPIKSLYSLGNSLELRLSEFDTEQFVYVLTQDSVGHWEFKSFSGEMDAPETVIPFTITNKGTDFAYIVFSNDSIKNFDTYFQALQHSTGLPDEQINTIFGNLLDKTAKFYPYRMSVSKPKTNKIAIIGFSLKSQ
jgi:Papain family cysteine protease